MKKKSKFESDDFRNEYNRVKRIDKHIVFEKDNDFFYGKVGFSWTAFFFGFWVYFFRKMWFLGFVWFLVFVLNVILTSLIGYVILAVIYSIYQGLTINKREINIYVMKGYKVIPESSDLFIGEKVDEIS